MFQKRLNLLKSINYSLIEYVEKFKMFIAPPLKSNFNYLYQYKTQMCKNLYFIYLFICCLITEIYPVISTQKLIKMVYVNEINTWLPEYIIRARYNRKTGKVEDYLQIKITRTFQQILPASLGYNKTQVFAYQGNAQHPITHQELGIIASFPAPTINVECAKPLFVNFTNIIKGPHLFKVAKNLVYDPLMTSNLNIDMTIVPTIAHLHGGVVESTSDGYPGAFVTSAGYRGPQYNSIRQTIPNSFVFYYPNYPQEQTMFYHDHMIGMTRLNVYAGMVGFYKIETRNATILNKIDPKYDVLIAIADRTFNDDGSLFYPDTWQPEFFGDAITVNGAVWPRMRVRNNTYRLRLLNGCNARFLNLTFVSNKTLLNFTVVKGDENYLDNSVFTNNILISPAQRYQILIDFTKYYGKKIEILNSASDQAPVNPNTTGKIMRFDVFQICYQANKVPSHPITFNRQKLSTLTPAETRNMILIEDTSNNPGSDDSNVLASFLGGQDTMVYLKPFIIGQTYEINFINLTPDSHPMHIHLTYFQIQSILVFDADTYKSDWIKLNGPPPIPLGKTEKDLDFRKYSNGTTLPIDPLENGLKDICLSDPGTVKITRVRFTQFDGTPYSFDASKGYGFAFHCHILQHEDNSMMRLFRLYKTTLSPKFVMNPTMP